MALPKIRRNQRHQNSLKALKAIAAGGYNKCVENWSKRWHACIGSGAYFEEYNKDLFYIM